MSKPWAWSRQPGEAEAKPERFLLPDYLGGGEVLASPTGFTIFGDDMWAITFPAHPAGKGLLLPRNILRKAPCGECGRPYTTVTHFPNGEVSYG